MRYIPNYTDTTKYRPLPRPEDGKVKLVFPRRSAPERGFWLLADVLPKILDKYPQAEIEFIGFVHEKDMADALAKWESDYPGRVSHRLVKADDMPSVYQNADISLIPTLYSEGTSLSCIEAMACGNAVIATNIGGLPNLIINDYNGLLISPDSDELYTAICKLIDSPELRRQISRNALLISQYFSKTVWENRWKSILQEFLLPQ
jgi:glycosyltransferase involved in cell wall biosynthesis